MMTVRPPVLRKFNPGTFQSDEDVIEQFVVRHREFGILMDVLGNNAGASICQHTLIVAPRGRGKTMMLARIAAELRTSEELRRHFMPVRFMEESYEVFHAGEFWLDALFHLVPEVARHDTEMASELREAHAEFASRWRGRDLEDLARAVVLETAKRLGRKVVLMVENCQKLFDDVDERFGWSLRKTLQTEPDVIFVGTATTRMAALEDVQGPFYEFFRPLLLEPLPLDECKALWEAASGEARSEREIRPLQILTGGDPRLLVIFAGFARHRSLKELLEELVSLIDDHTAYFRSHLEGLGKTERRVYVALVDLWRPSTTAEIAARSMQDIRAVSSLLGRLVKRGAVAYEGKGQKRLYSATQRLYSIYYKLRRMRDEAVVVSSLIQWMVACFTSDELSAMGEQLAEEAMQSASIREGFRLALRDMPAIRKTFSEVAGHIDLAEAHGLIDTALQFIQGDDLAAALAACDQTMRHCGGNEGSIASAWALAIKGCVHRRLQSHDDAIKTFDALLARSSGSDAPAFRFAVCLALANKAAAQVEARRLTDALETCSDVDKRFGADPLGAIQTWVAAALNWRGFACALLGKSEAAVEAWDTVSVRYGTEGPSFDAVVAIALAAKSALLTRLGNTAMALATCVDLAERFADSDEPSVRRTVADAIVHRPEMLVQLGRPDEAMATIENLGRSSTPPDPPKLQWIEWTKARALLGKGERQLALEALQSAYDKLVVDENTPRLLLHHVPELIGGGLTEKELLLVLTSDPHKAAQMAPIVATLKQRIGESVRVPVEVLEVAQDLAAPLNEAIACAKAHWSSTASTAAKAGASNRRKVRL